MGTLMFYFIKNKRRYLKNRQCVLRRTRLISRNFLRLVDFILGRSEKISIICCKGKYIISTKHDIKWLVLCSLCLCFSFSPTPKHLLMQCGNHSAWLMEPMTLPYDSWGNAGRPRGTSSVGSRAPLRHDPVVWRQWPLIGVHDYVTS